MRARLTDIRLYTGDRLFEIGEEVVGGEDLPLELLQARLAAGTAVLVPPDGEVLDTLQAAIDIYLELARPTLPALQELVELALAGPTGSASRVLAAFDAFGASLNATPRISELAELAERETRLAQDPDAGGDAASEAGGEHVGRSPPAETSTDAPPQTAARQDEPGANPPAAATPSSSTAKKPAASKRAAGDKAAAK